MRPNGPEPSSSTKRAAVLTELRAVRASTRAKALERLQFGGLSGYLLIWFLRPVFEIAIVGLIYASRPDLLSYAVVAIAGNALLFNSIYYCSELLDRERLSGTLVGLFLAPCSRYAWLGGFQLIGIIETIPIVAAALVFGHYAYGVAFDPNIATVLVTLVLFLLALWGLSMIFGALGLLLKKANELSNLVYPFLMLLGGVLYPVAVLPDWLRIPAQLLPMGYGFQALVDATLHDAGLVDVSSQLVPLAAFAVALPIAGVHALRWIERMVRVRGELDLY